MFITTDHHHDHKKPTRVDLQIQHHNKSSFSKESSTSSSSSSSLLYYGGRPGSVPFLWESCPGTPKSKFSEHDSLIPPLTPPPSYHSYSYSNSSFSSRAKNTASAQKRSRSNLILNTLFPKRMNLNKTTSSSLPNSSSWSSLESSTTNSVNSTPTTTFHGRNTSRFSSSSSSFDSRGEEGYEDQVHGTSAGNNSPTSTLCFGFGRRATRGGCYRF